MSFDADAIVDRRRLKRRLSLWRFGAILAVVVALFALAAEGGLFPTRPHIARVEISGIILDDRVQRELIEEIAEDSSVKAIILAIDSPGGTSSGAEALYETARKAAEDKPTVAVLGNIAASGGYIAALATDHIVARGNTITGSIGVFVQLTELSDLLDKVGVDVSYVRSGPLKAQPNPFEPATEEGVASTQDVVDASYNWFVDLVAERRGLDPDEARRLGDGRIYAGFQAVDNGLIDMIGGEEAAVAWLAETHGIDEDLPIEEWQPDYGTLPGGGFAARALYGLGFGFASGLAEKTLETKRLMLDGLNSVWHPERQ